MTEHDLFASSALDWMREDNVAGDVVRILDNSFRTSSGRDLEWRTNIVSDFRGHSGVAAAERLIRWDRRHPNDIFGEGFLPIVAPQSLAEFEQLPDDQINVADYVNENRDSVFVSTARYYTVDNRATRWQPRNINNSFEYEIFAHGGIDVNLSMGSYHQYWNQREILFPGGIRPESIRTAREYNEEGRVVRLWANGAFDVNVLHDDIRPRLAALPNPVCGINVPIQYWTGQAQFEEAHVDTRAALQAVSDDRDDLMRGDGDPMMPDDAMVGDECLEDWTPVRSCLPVPNQDDPSSITTYFFTDTCWAKIQRFPGPGDNNTHDKVLEGPTPIMDSWPELRKAGFARIDAAWPRLDNAFHTYFFLGPNYVLVDIQTHELLEGPHPFKDRWPSLVDTGFDALDSALPVGDNDVHVFRGDQYAAINRNRETENITGPFLIADKWDGLREAGFTDNLHITLWELKRDVYYFRDDKYIIMNIDSTEKTYGPTEVRSTWSVLIDANFY
ncbi:Hemopexin domain-containing protein [Moniliophthora roreri MCA 2997]|uniref:Hemopexin domain-containing protein n=1 Tax=Moniliophthora roreri (strain MCA 2997) TaxID=1381753 RepID=V2XGE9_MONRO|nr:Hemopexin domain-containing protein [Moniliophthora roreri MCA 2997]